LETIREYAAERLDESGDGEALRRRHVDYFLDLAEGMQPERHDAADPDSLARLDDDHDNFRAALTASADAPATQLRLAVALWPLWRGRGYLSEARVRVEEVLRDVLQGGEAAEARSYFEGALGAAPASPLARERLGVLALHDGDHGRARRLFEETLAAYRHEHDTHGIRVALMDLGLVALAEGEIDEAASFFNESLSLFDPDDAWGVSYCVEDLAAVMAAGDPRRAVELLGWADRVRERLQHPLDAFEQGIQDRTLAAIREQPDQGTFASAWARGRRMTEEEAVRRASAAHAAERP
jgi:tetratricopeptide (TPR) repeat protein